MVEEFMIKLKLYLKIHWFYPSTSQMMELFKKKLF